MLDVHAPEHRIGGVRDFFIHLLTITAGLLIAIALEQSVEALHHRHQREQAEELIRKEVQSNLNDVRTTQNTVKAEMADLQKVLAYMDARLGGGKPVASGLRLQLTEIPLKDAAWRTAAATGVASYMDYETVENFAGCYKEQELFEQMQQRVLEGYLGMEAFVAVKHPDQLTDAELREALPVVRHTLSELDGTRDVSKGLVAACSPIAQ